MEELKRKPVTKNSVYFNAHMCWTQSYARFLGIIIIPLMIYIFEHQKLEFSGFGYMSETPEGYHMYNFESACLQFFIFFVAEWFCLLSELEKEHIAEHDILEQRRLDGAENSISAKPLKGIAYIWKTRIKSWPIASYVFQKLHQSENHKISDAGAVCGCVAVAVAGALAGKIKMQSTGWMILGIIGGGLLGLIGGTVVGTCWQHHMPRSSYHGGKSFYF